MITSVLDTSISIRHT